MSGIVGSYFNTRGSGIVAKLGTDGQVFTSTGAGLSQGFEAAAGGGKILQVVAGTEQGSSTATNATIWTAMNLEVDITPSATSSKVYVTSMFMGYGLNGGSHNDQRWTMFRDSTNLGDDDAGLHTNNGNARVMEITMIYLDSPSTTSEVKYEIYARCFSAPKTLTIGYGDGSIYPHQVIYAFEIDGS